MVSFVTFVIYTKIAGKELDATTSFTSLALFNALRAPLIYFPNVLLQFFSARISLKRISSFLKQGDLEGWDNNRNTFIETEPPTGTTVGFTNAWFTWFDDITETKPVTKAESLPLVKGLPKQLKTPEDPPCFSLKNLHVNFPVGGLSVICGATGSGKSSVMQALLGG